MNHKVAFCFGLLLLAKSVVPEPAVAASGPTSKDILPGLKFPSSAGNISGPMATNGGYIYESVDVSHQGQAGITNGGKATYSFTITNAGQFIIAAVVNAPNMASKSFWLNIDAPPVDPAMIWDIYPYTANGFLLRAVSWRGNGTDTKAQFNPQVFNLSVGVHQLIIVGREANVQLGQITIVPYSPNNAARPLPPTGLRVVAGP